MLKFLPAMFLIGFVLEIASIIWVGGMLGVLTTLLLLLLGGVVGAGILKSAGVNAADALRSPIQSAATQKKAASSTILRVVSGLLFIVPGFFSDMVAVLLLLPPVRWWLETQLNLSVVSTSTEHGMRDPRTGGVTIIDAEAIEIEGEIARPGEPPTRRWTDQ